MRLKELVDELSKSWRLTAREKADGRNFCKKPDRLLIFNEVSPHLQFKGVPKLGAASEAIVPVLEHPILHLNLSDVEAVFWDTKRPDFFKAMYPTKIGFLVLNGFVSLCIPLVYLGDQLTWTCPMA